MRGLLLAALAVAAACASSDVIVIESSFAAEGEFRSAPSWHFQGFSGVTLANRHIVRLKFVLPPYNPLEGQEIKYAVTADYGGLGPRLNTNEPSHGLWPIDEQTGAWCLWRVAYSEGETVEVHLGSDALLAGNHITFIVRATWEEGEPPSTTTMVKYTAIDLDFSKVMLNDAAIDARLAYANQNDPPNPQTGEYGADPNAHARNLNFGDWHFRGGLFVGHMTFASGDRSRTARLQLSANPVFVLGYETHQIFLSAMYLGLPTEPATGSSFTLGAFLPELPASLYEMDVTWATKWNINPRLEPSDPPDYTQDPIAMLTASELHALGPSDGVEQYANWLLTPEDHGLEYIQRAFNVCLALHDEGSFVSGSNSVWRYFASREYGAQFDEPDWWIEDSAPRLWVIHRRVRTWFDNP